MEYTIPLIRVNQRNEYLYTSRMTVEHLRKLVLLNFRYPYLESQSSSSKEKMAKYIEKIKKNTSKDLVTNKDSMQRLLDFDKLRAISDYINEENNIIPNAIILGCYNKNIENDSDAYFDYESEIQEVDPKLGVYKVDLNENYELVTIDGQHRLAGLFMNENFEISQMQLPVVLLFGVSPTTWAKIFVDINSTQKAVAKSWIYDLVPILAGNNSSMTLNKKEVSDLAACHKLCKAFYEKEGSPLFHQIKMLGSGKGAVSQAFLVESMYPIIHNGVLSDYDEQIQFNAFYYLFKSLQICFPNDWPVLNDDNKIKSNEEKKEEYAYVVLNKRKSKLAKTLGLGAFLKIFPDIFERCQFEPKRYLEIIGKIKGKIAWSEEEAKNNPKMLYISGNSRSALNELSRELKKLMDI